MQCRQCYKEYVVASEDRVFYDKITPVFAGKSYRIPDPTLCSSCRRQRRLIFRNENKFYSRTCDCCKRDIISIYAPDKEQVVYCMKCWWSEKYTPTDYGMDYDPSKPFFVQLATLLKKTPLPNLIASPDAEENNCNYVNCAGNNKDCYMLLDGDSNQDCYYSNGLNSSKNSIDCLYVSDSELCYESVDCRQCYNLYYSQDCSNCRDSYFLKNCVSCNNCILSTNLQHKEYYINNQPYSKADYERYLEQLHLHDRSNIPNLYAKLQGLDRETPHKFFHGFQLENSTGDYLYNVKNCQQTFLSQNCEDLKYCDSMFDAKDCYDVSSFGENAERCYECTSVGANAYEIYFSQLCAGNVRNLYFNLGSRNSKDCFGCVALRGNQYCILNKQYSKEEYEKLAGQIIEKMIQSGGWGESLPPFISPFAYNESVAQTFIPISKEEASKLGAKWRDEPTNTISASTPIVPSDIKIVPDTIINETLSCATCHKKYRLIKEELKLYRDHNIPVPTNCFICRYRNRFSKRNPEQLWNRHCMKCMTPIETSYSPTKEEIIVYCEKCYLETLQ